LRDPPHPGSEDAITPALAGTRRLYRAAYRKALTNIRPELESWLAARRVLPAQRRSCTRQLAHAEACTILLTRPSRPPGRPFTIPQPVPRRPLPRRPGACDMDIRPDLLDALDRAGDALAALGEEVVLLGFYRAGPGLPADRYSVRLEIPGAPCGIQESASAPAAALARALSTRAARRATLEREASIRIEAAQRGDNPAGAVGCASLR
jgi:hypothetical protein